MRSLPINLPAHRAEPACDFARAAFRALLVEVNLTPPGLVDRHNTGAHRDMDPGTSIAAPAPSACGCRALSNAGAKTPLCRQNSSWRGCGRSARPAKTRCFALPAALTPTRAACSRSGCCAPPSAACSSRAAPSAPKRCAPRWRRCAGGWWIASCGATTPGRPPARLFAAHGLSGARGEAEAGFRLVIDGALPLYRQRLAGGDDEQRALLDSLLWLMAHNDDTNVARAAACTGCAGCGAGRHCCWHRAARRGGGSGAPAALRCRLHRPQPQPRRQCRPVDSDGCWRSWVPKNNNQAFRRVPMSQTREKIWKAIAPLAVLAILLLIPVPDGMPPQAGTTSPSSWR